jgi:hypothetical protein
VSWLNQLFVNYSRDKNTGNACYVEFENQAHGKFNQVKVKRCGPESRVYTGVYQAAYPAGREPDITQFADENPEK